MAEWIHDSRLKGIARYHLKMIGKIVVWATLLLLGVQILSMVISYITNTRYSFDGIRADFEIIFFASFVTGILTAGRSSRFLLRFGTSRTSVWLGNVLGLQLGMIAFLLGTFLLNILIGLVLIPLSTSMPDAFRMDSVQFSEEFSKGLQNLPDLLLYTLEWTSIFYLYACLFRRFKVLTISFTVGVPLFFAVLMFIPAVREAISVLEGNDQGQIVILGLKWLQIIQNIMQFVQDHWDALQLTAGIVSLPLSYLVMRSTKQP